MNDFEKEFMIATEEFHEQVLNNLTDRNFTYFGRTIEVNRRRKMDALRNICPKNKILELSAKFQAHMETLRKHQVLCSEPKAFRTAWDLREEETLNIYQTQDLKNLGANLVPEGSFNKSRVFKIEQPGILLSRDKLMVLGVRHSKEGEFDDSIDHLGTFIYYPAKTLTDMLRFRWCQFIAKALNINVMLLAIVWFKLEGHIPNQNHMFVISTTSIIDIPDEVVSDENLEKPLTLQLIPSSEAQLNMNVIASLNNKLSISPRTVLPPLLKQMWAYPKISSTKKGTNGYRLRKWAQLSGKKCPGCNHDLTHFPLNKIHIGHIIFQNHCNAFPFLLDDVHHPHNLYLSCETCNQTLNANFPDPMLYRRIMDNGTVGDWVQQFEEEMANIV